MKWSLWMTGKTTPTYYKEACDDYLSRTSKIIDIEELILPDIKNAASMPMETLTKKESEQILSKLLPTDFVVLLDERGKSYDSEGLSKWMEKMNMASYKRCIFIIGGAFGFDESVLKRSNQLLSLSSMTFSHQLVRVVFLEQFYRASCILKGIPYHHA